MTPDSPSSAAWSEGAYPAELGFRERSNLADLHRQLQHHWGLGRNLVLGWCGDAGDILALIVPHYAIADYCQAIPADTTIEPGVDAAGFINRLLAGPRHYTDHQLRTAARLLGTEPQRLRLRQPLTGSPAEAMAVDRLVARYGIRFVPSRAVALFDIVGFSLRDPFEQMAQINSLTCSLNAVHSKLLSRRVHVDFARSSTGDGFYVWNRSLGPESDINLYHFMHLVLADNAIARQKANGRTVPLLRTAFHIGSCYELQHAEGLNPTLYSHIVGEVTISLARMIASGMPGQILVGEFANPRDAADGARYEATGAAAFLEAAQPSLQQLNGLELSGEAIESIKCYLTGMARADGTFSIRRLSIEDKHGVVRGAYNAKVNIYRRGAKPILLGIQDRALRLEALNLTAERVALSPDRRPAGSAGNG